MAHSAFVTDALLRKSVVVCQSLGRHGVSVSAGGTTRLSPAFFSRHCQRTLVYLSPVTQPEQFAATLLEYLPLQDRIDSLDDITRTLFLATKAMDATRPVIDASGYAHRVGETDIFDSHLYEQNPKLFAERMEGLGDGKPYVNALPGGGGMSVGYAGQPYFCSEFGGIWWDPDANDTSGSDRAESWGYGRRPADEDELVERFRGLV